MHKCDYNIFTEKIELAKLLPDTEDESLILKIKALFSVHEKDFREDLPLHVKEGILLSQEQARKGLLRPQEEIMFKYTRYL